MTEVMERRTRTRTRTGTSISRPTLTSMRSSTRPRLRPTTNIMSNVSSSRSITLSRHNYCPHSEVSLLAASESLELSIATATGSDDDGERRRQRRQRQPTRRRTTYSPLLLFLGAYAYAFSFSLPVVSVHAFYPPHQQPYQRSTKTSWTHLATSSSNANGSNRSSNHDDSDSGSGNEHSNDNSNSNNDNNNDRRNSKKNSSYNRRRNIPPRQAARGFSQHVQPSKNAPTNSANANQTSVTSSMSTNTNTKDKEDSLQISSMLQRLTQLENLVATQALDIRRLQDECRDLTEAAVAFQRVVELLRQAGLDTNEEDDEEDNDNDDMVNSGKNKLPIDSLGNIKSSSAEGGTGAAVVSEYKDIFGTAPASVIEAADAAGIAILAGMLGGKQRLLVDVRDADLSRNPETLVQFIELAILPVAAGLEGLSKSMERYRLKIVFPKVSQLLEYRKTMALSSPDVVALSTLGFEPVEPEDNLVVIIAPAPDDEEGLQAMNELLAPTSYTDDSDDGDDSSSFPQRPTISQPVVVLNHYMVPLSGPAADFEVAYHLRLLSVQYMSNTNAAEYFRQFGAGNGDDKDDDTKMSEEGLLYSVESSDTAVDMDAFLDGDLDVPSSEDISRNSSSTSDDGSTDFKIPEDEALEAAMKHAHEVGINQGMTRGMVIRAYPKPWHVFVDTSPDTDADFEVAATFEDEPTQEEVYMAVVECLEGSAREDELVAQQMQLALETGQLDRISEMLGSMGVDIFDDHEDSDDDEDEDDDDDDDDIYRDLFGTEDSV